MSELATKLERRRSLNNESVQDIPAPNVLHFSPIPRRKSTVKENASKFSGTSGIDTVESSVARAQKMRDEQVCAGAYVHQYAGFAGVCGLWRYVRSSQHSLVRSPTAAAATFTVCIPVETRTTAQRAACSNKVQA